MGKSLYIAVILAGLFSVSCVSQQTDEHTVIDTSNIIPVTLNGIKVADLKVTDIANLPQISLSVNGEEKSGPTLDTVMDEIGIISYMAVTASGYAPEDTEDLSLELTEIELGSEIIFTVDRGQMSLFGMYIPPEYWHMEIKDIAVIACECGLIQSG